MNKKKVCVVTGGRSDYGILKGLLFAIKADNELQLQLVATGSHFSYALGSTYKEIEGDGFKLSAKIESLMDSDEPSAISKSIGLGLISLSDCFKELDPDVVVILGDRYEIIPAAIAAMMSCIPIAHIHGGEVTIGAIDDSIRHAITKMASLHFVATSVYQKRVLQLGENPENVFNVGSLSVEAIQSMNLLNKRELEESLGIKFANKNILVTMHPETLNYQKSLEDLCELLDALACLKEVKIIFTKANADMGSKVFNEKIKEFTEKNENSVLINSFGQLRYFSCMKYVDAVIGNSSSGILEAPSFAIPTINIGERQGGRICACSVLNIKGKKNEIISAINKIYTRDFKDSLKNIHNPYQKEFTSKNIVEILKNADLKSLVSNKRFLDLH